MAVTPADIAVELGLAAPESGSVTEQQWAQWITDALMLIEARLVGDGSSQVASLGDLDQTKLDYVVRQAVAGHVRRPDDATQVSVQIDDGSTSRTYRSSKGRVTISDDLWNLLSPDDTNGGAFSIRPAGCGTVHADVCSANTYVAANGAIMFGGAYCSCGAEYAGYPLYEV